MILVNTATLLHKQRKINNPTPLIISMITDFVKKWGKIFIPLNPNQRQM